MKPFSFQCFLDVCVFPDQYCNSDKHERICHPCLPSVCSRKDVKLQCGYNCSMRSRSADDYNDYDDNTGDEITWVGYVCIVLTVINLLFMMHCVWGVWKKNRIQKIKKTRSAEEVALVRNTDKATEGTGIETEGTDKETETDKETKCTGKETGGNASEQPYSEKKLKDIPATNDSLNNQSYVPTTCFSKRKDNSDTQSMMVDVPDANPLSS